MRMSGWFGPRSLLLVYLLIALTPLALAWSQDLPRRPLLDDLSSSLAAVAFAMLLVEFLISGRFEVVSGQLGIDRAIRFHRTTALILMAFVLIHPYLYTLPIQKALPWDWSKQLSLGVSGPSLIAGVAAWILLPLLVFWAMFRREIPYKYETWRLCHGIGALLIALLVLFHTVKAGRYSAHDALFWFWIILTSIAVLALIEVYLLRPLLQRKHPYRVVSVEPIALKTWDLVIEPEKDAALEFQAGQFAWLNFSGTPYNLMENPFSISTCPSQCPRIGFAIKEMGDFTSSLGSIEVGRRVHVDGPHGNFSIAGRDAKGLVFIAGGVGMAPIMGILRQMVHDGDTRPCRLIYGNRTIDQIMYPSELEQLADSLNLTIHHVLSEPPPDWDEPVGQLGYDELARLLDNKDSDHWLHLVCGPEPMIESVEQTLQKLGVPPARILSERFT